LEKNLGKTENDHDIVERNIEVEKNLDKTGGDCHKIEGNDGFERRIAVPIDKIETIGLFSAGLDWTLVGWVPVIHHARAEL
jgi:hypothetical protein